MFRLYFIVILVVIPAFAYAYDAEVGPQTSAKTTVSVVIPKLIRVQSVSDFDMGTYISSSDNLTGSDDLNIGSNAGSSLDSYNVTINGSGANGEYVLQSQSTVTIPFSVYFNDEIGLVGREKVTSGIILSGQNGATPLYDSTPNANLSIEINKSALTLSDANYYQGSLIVLIQPD